MPESPYIKWQKTIAGIIERDFDERAMEDLVVGLEAFVSGGSSTIFVYPLGKFPYSIFQHLLSDESPEYHLDAYLSGPYLVDPFYLAAREEGAEGVYLLHEIAPEGFESSEYYRLYYNAVDLTDEACLIFRHEGQTLVVVSLGRHSKEPDYSEEDKQRLAEAFPVVRAIVSRCMERHKGAMLEKNIRGYLDAALDNFGTSLLTPREREIINLLLRGHSVKSIAERLDNSAETIKHHRKNIYTKLDICSQSELFHLFLDSLRSYDKGMGDPLVGYFDNG